jgi:hypothetical protein
MPVLRSFRPIRNRSIRLAQKFLNEIAIPRLLKFYHEIAFLVCALAAAFKRFTILSLGRPLISVAVSVDQFPGGAYSQTLDVLRQIP